MTATTTDVADDRLEGLDVCRDPFDESCRASLDDNEGWDGACGNCADRLYANEFNDVDDDDDSTAVDGGDVEARS
ncbi:hypothetical protein MycrhDRAFT_5493 [Mycolicibacterium rhodesiae JS60]|nr:hypothetical protein MycrhDRAFT_5493 [Mycolicibacterium rhodesiae JS60]